MILIYGRAAGEERANWYMKCNDKHKSGKKTLHASGGALALNKCFWIGLFLKFENGLPRAAKIEETPWEIHLTSGYSTERQLIQ